MQQRRSVSQEARTDAFGCLSHHAVGTASAGTVCLKLLHPAPAGTQQDPAPAELLGADAASMLVTCSVVPCSALHCCVQADRLLCTYTSVNCSQQPASGEEPVNLPGEMPVLATLWKKDSMSLEKHHIC